MTEDSEKARVLADSGVGRQLRQHIRDSSFLHNWSGEIRSSEDLEILNRIQVYWDIWEEKGMVKGELEDHPVLGKVVRSIRTRNVNDSIQKTASELGLFTSLIGPEDYALSMLGIDDFSPSGDAESLKKFFMREMDVSAATIHIFGRQGTGKTDLTLLLLQLRSTSKKILISSNMESFSGQDKYVTNLGELEAWMHENPDIEKWFVFDEASSEYNSKIPGSSKGKQNFGSFMRKVRKSGGKLIIIGHRDNDVDKDARDLSTFGIEKPNRYDPKIAVIHVDGRRILVKDIPKTLFEFDTNDVGEFSFDV